HALSCGNALAMRPSRLARSRAPARLGHSRERSFSEKSRRDDREMHLGRAFRDDFGTRVAQVAVDAGAIHDPGAAPHLEQRVGALHRSLADVRLAKGAEQPVEPDFFETPFAVGRYL